MFDKINRIYLAFEFDYETDYFVDAYSTLLLAFCRLNRMGYRFKELDGDTLIFACRKDGYVEYTKILIVEVKYEI